MRWGQGPLGPHDPHLASPLGHTESQDERQRAEPPITSATSRENCRESGREQKEEALCPFGLCDWPFPGTQMTLAQGCSGGAGPKPADSPPSAPSSPPGSPLEKELRSKPWEGQAQETQAHTQCKPPAGAPHLRPTAPSPRERTLFQHLKGTGSPVRALTPGELELGASRLSRCPVYAAILWPLQEVRLFRPKLEVTLGLSKTEHRSGTSWHVEWNEAQPVP